MQLSVGIHTGRDYTVAAVILAVLAIALLVTANSVRTSLTAIR